MFSYVLLALFVTEAAELLTAAVMGIRKVYDLRVVFLVNMMTNPLISALYLIGGVFTGQKLKYLLFAAEILVWISEGWVYKKCLEEKSFPLLLSGAANLMSLLCGYLVGRCL